MKKTLILLLALCMTVGFIACSSGSSDKSTDSSLDSQIASDTAPKDSALSSSVEAPKKVIDPAKQAKDFSSSASLWTLNWSNHEEYASTFTSSYDEANKLTIINVNFNNEEPNPLQKATDIERNMKDTLQYEQNKEYVHLAINIYDVHGNTVLSTYDGQPAQ